MVMIIWRFIGQNWRVYLFVSFIIWFVKIHSTRGAVNCRARIADFPKGIVLCFRSRHSVSLFTFINSKSYYFNFRLASTLLQKLQKIIFFPFLFKLFWSRVWRWSCTSSSFLFLHYKILPWKALRSKAVSMNLFSSFRWVDLVPVAGAAAGSRPTYLTATTAKHERGCQALVAFLSWKWGLTKLTKRASCWPPLWGDAAGRSRSSPCSCAPPDTRPALHRRTFRSPVWPSQTGMGRSEERRWRMRERGNHGGRGRWTWCGILGVLHLFQSDDGNVLL